MRTRYRDVLDHELGARIAVRFATEGRAVTDYAVILTVDIDGKEAIVRVYDGVHGHNEMHRYDSAGQKASAESFHAGSLGEGMRAAISAVRGGYGEMN